MKIVQNTLKVFSLLVFVMTLGNAQENEIKKAYFEEGVSGELSITWKHKMV